MVSEQDYEGQESGGALRAQLEAALKEAKEAKAALAEAQSSIRQMQVSSVLDARGVNKKVAQFIPADADSPEAIAKWLDENADVFGGGVQASEQEAPVDVEPAAAKVSSEDESRSRRLQDLGSAAGAPTSVVDFENRIRQASSDDEVFAILKEAQQYALSE